MYGVGLDLGKYLKKKREDAGLTQTEVGEALGYTSGHQYISNWERGLSSPPLAKLNELIKLYHIDSDELITVILTNQERFLRKVLKKKIG